MKLYFYQANSVKNKTETLGLKLVGPYLCVFLFIIMNPHFSHSIIIVIIYLFIF